MKIEEIDLDARDQFVICEKRYYAAMWFVRLPEQDNDLLRLGGDVNALLWHKDEDPNHWIFQWRFRYYKSRDIWQSHDEKNWFCVEVDGDREKVEADMEFMLTMLSQKSGFPLEKLVVNGNNDQFYRACREQNPSWLHHGIPDEQANKGGNPKTN